MKPLLCLFLGLTLFASSPLTFAQTPKKEVPYADKQKAKDLATEAVAAFKAKDYEKALKAFREAYALNPEFKYLPPIAQCSLFLGRYDEAVALASQYLQEAEPDNPKRPEVEKLLLDARAALDKQNQDKVSKTKINAEIAFSAADYEKALALFQEAYTAAPGPELLYKIAQCHSKLKHTQEALNTFEAFLQSTPANDPLRGSAEKQMTALKEEAAKPTTLTETAQDELLQAKAKAEAAFAAQKYQEAVVSYQKAYSIDPAPALLFLTAESYRLLGKKQEALSTYQAFLEKAPANDPQRASAEKAIKKLTAPDAVNKEEPSAGGSSGKGLFVVAGVSGGLCVVPGVVAALSARKLNELTAVTSRLDVNAAEIEKFESRRKRAALVSDVMLGVALAAGGAGIVIKSKSKKAEKLSSASLSVTPTGAALSVQY